MTLSMTQYLTTKELAELLRIKERKVYDLAASGAVPCSKAHGKLLFPRDAIEAWIAGALTGPTGGQGATIGEFPSPRPAVFLGSHDPLLDWSLQESQCGLATLFEGSLNGLARFRAREGVATGLHVLNAVDGNWNSDADVISAQGQDSVLIHFCKRERGLLCAKSKRPEIGTINDLAGRRFAPRQSGAGAHHLFEHLASSGGLTLDSVRMVAPARSEFEAALAVREGRADAAFGLRVYTTQLDLGFVPLLIEDFDILITRKAYFEAPLQRWLAFCQSDAFATRAGELAGYDVTDIGSVVRN